MNSKENSNSDELLEVLESYAIATPEGNDKALLNEWIDTYPAFAEDLIRFAANRELLDYPSNDDFKSEEEKQTYLRRSRETYLRFINSREAILNSIFKRAEELDIKKRELTDRLGISLTFLNTLEKRVIEYSSIPARFIAQVAEVLQLQAEAVASYLQRPVMQAEFHKNTSRPEESRAMSFSEAVSDDFGLTEEQKKSLLSLTAE